ncbi:MAG: Trk system potassium transporter TrkA [Candidatus Margulisiibacteriota bacterium]
MKITILGAGEVGHYLAEKLSCEGHHITIIDSDPKAIERVSANLDILAVNDSCINADALKQAGIESSDMVISVTRLDEINLVSSLLAKDLGVPFTIARVRSIQESVEGYSFPYHKFGVDKVINPEWASAMDIVKLARTGKDISQIMHFANGKIQLIRVDIRENVKLAGQKISAIREKMKDHSFLIIMVIRKGEEFIPRGDFELQEEDKIYLMIETAHYSDILYDLGIKSIKNKRIIIMGGDDIAYITAKKLEKEYKSVKIIEEDIKRCDYLAENLQSAIVLNGDGSNVNLLQQERIKETDIFIAAHSDDKKNLLSGLLAKKHGAKKIICLVRTPDYVPMVEDLGLDHVIIPRVSVTNEILSYVREGKIMSVSSFVDTGAEIVEQEITNKCSLTEKKLKDLHLPGGILIGAVIKAGEKALIPNGDYQPSLGDRVVMFSNSACVKILENLFK